MRAQVGSADRAARELALGACLCAAGIVVPMLFHAVGLGKVFLPMHLPVLIAALLLRPRVALTAAIVTPWASMLLTGMPPFPYAVMMTAELAALAAIASLLTSWRVPAWAAAPAAIAGRCAVTWGIYSWLGAVLGLPSQASGLASIASGLPGVLLQLAIAPAAATAIRSRRRAGHDAAE